MNDAEEMGVAYVREIAALRDSKQADRLMGKISLAKQYKRPVSPVWWTRLEQVCEPARLERFRKRHFKVKKKRKKGRTKAIASRVKVTRTVKYTYDESDNDRLATFYTTPEWKLIRYEALRKHGAKCQCCGRSAAAGIVLHVDHIKPLRVFWDLRLDINNLQVLCGDCNEGKGARHADDWRPPEKAAN